MTNARVALVSSTRRFVSTNLASCIAPGSARRPPDVDELLFEPSDFERGLRKRNGLPSRSAPLQDALATRGFQSPPQQPANTGANARVTL